MAESAFEGRSKNFAIEMLRTALHDDGIQEIWVNHRLEYAEDDKPMTDRHFFIKVNLEHYCSIEAECWVHSTGNSWNRGEVRFHSIRDGKPENVRQRQYYRYHPEKGMEYITGTTIVLAGNVAYIEGQNDRFMAMGTSPLEALGELVRNHQERFRLVIRKES